MHNKLTSHVRTFLAAVPRAPGRSLVVAVSGGPDSLALLHVLRGLLPGERLVVAHLDHRLRPESGAEAAALAALAAAWGLPWRARAVDVRTLAVERGWSLEEAGRQARYTFLAEVAREVGATAVLTGHHADDQAETVLLHLLRGSGLSGLRGMADVAPLPGTPEIVLLRPLLACTRKEIEAYCAGHALRPFQDASNQDSAFERNRVRQELLPALTTYNPGIRRHLRHLAELAAAEEALLEGLVDEVWPAVLHEAGPGWLVLDRAQFQTQPLALRRRLLRRAYAGLRQDTADLSFEAVEGALAVAAQPRAAARAGLPGGLFLLADEEALILTATPDAVATSLPQLASAKAVSLPVPGQVSLANGWLLSAEPGATTLDEIRANRDRWQVHVQLGEGEQLLVRPRATGERLQPLGMNGRSAGLQDVFVNRKVPGRLRSLWPVVTTAEHIVWLPGHVLDHRARVTGADGRVVLLRCRPIDEREAL